jgi:hypothetical protein
MGDILCAVPPRDPWSIKDSRLWRLRVRHSPGAGKLKNNPFYADITSVGSMPISRCALARPAFTSDCRHYCCPGLLLEFTR